MDVHLRPPGFINRPDVLQRLGGNRELLQRLGSLFLQAAPESLEKMSRMLQDGEFEPLALEAHRLKGQVGFFTTGEPFQLTRTLESAAYAGNADAARESFAALRKLSIQLLEELQEFLSTP